MTTAARKVLDFGWQSGRRRGTRASVAIPTMYRTASMPAISSATMTTLVTNRHAAPATDSARIWALVVLYEMLVGAPAFAGDNVSDTIAAVLRSELDWTLLPANTPAAIVRLLRRCLNKDHTRRLADIADARIEIDDAIAVPATLRSAVPSTSPRNYWRLAAAGWIVSAILATATLAILFWSSGRGSTDPTVTRLELNLPTNVELYTNNPNGAALSPDGTKFAFVGARRVHADFLPAGRSVRGHALV